jgi:hypothetical protein
VDCADRHSDIPRHYLPVALPLDGEWRQGTLLTTPRSALPTLDSGALEALLAEAARALTPYQPKFVPTSNYKPSAAAVKARKESERIEAEMAERTDDTISWAAVRRLGLRERPYSDDLRAKFIEAYDAIAAAQSEGGESADEKRRREMFERTTGAMLDRAS